MEARSAHPTPSNIPHDRSRPPADDPAFYDACRSWSHYLDRYRALAAELHINIVPGTIVQTDPPAPDHEPHAANVDPATTIGEGALSNVAYFIDAAGAIRGSYTKKNLWGPVERGHLRSSGRVPHPVLDTPLGKVGLLICWDLAFPEAFRELIAAGAQLIVIPTFWVLTDCSPEGRAYNPSAEALFLDSTLTSRAFENTCAIVFVNAGGPPGKGFCGLSQVVAPFVGPVIRLGSCQEGMGIADLAMEMVEVAERNYRVREDLARGDWHYDYRHGLEERDATDRE